MISHLYIYHGFRPIWENFSSFEIFFSSFLALRRKTHYQRFIFGFLVIDAGGCCYISINEGNTDGSSKRGNNVYYRSIWEVR